MPRKTTIQGKIILELLDKYPNTPSLTLAKKAAAENPKVFLSVDAARNTVRYYRGAMGREKRKKIKVRDHIREFDPSSFNPFKLPESDEAEFLPYYLPKTAKKILLLSDVHIPYHNIEALTAALQKGKEDNIDTIYLNGDILDFYGLSFFEKDPRKRGFKYELDAGREFLSILRREFPSAKIYYKIGNHEERYERYLKVKAPELLDCSEFEIQHLLRFGEHKVELITDKRIVYAGKLRLLHGHEFRTSVFSPVNPARGYYMKAKKSMIAGHNHQTSEHTEPDLDDEITTVWSVGCLCELHPEYMPINKWNHGFARINVEDDGDYSVQNYRIIKGEIV